MAHRSRRRTAGGRPVWCVWAVLLFACSFTQAWAQQPGHPAFNPDRPGLADTSSVIGRGRFQIEIGAQREHHREDLRDTWTWFVPTLLRFGLTDRWELRLESNSFAQTSTVDPVDGTSRVSGYAPISLGVKHRFLEAAASSASPSLGVILRAFVPSGSSDFRSDRVSADVRLAMDSDLGAGWSLNPNVGIGRYEDDSGQTFLAAIVAATLTRALGRATVSVDAGVQKPEARGGAAAAGVDVGVTWLLGDNMQLDFNPGARVAGQTPAKYFWTAGISRRF